MPEVLPYHWQHLGLLKVIIINIWNTLKNFFVLGHPVKVVAKEDLLPCREIMLNMLGADVIKVPLEVNPGSHNGVFGLCKRLSKEITPSVVLNPVRVLVFPFFYLKTNRIFSMNIAITLCLITTPLLKKY